MPTMLPSNMTQEQTKSYLLQLEIEDLTKNLRSGEYLVVRADNRSPSPEPVYDAQNKLATCEFILGFMSDTKCKRTNTRELRKRQELEHHRHDKIQQLLKLNSAYKPPADYRSPQVRLSDKVYIPQDDHPEINFVGLLIGPRGNTLKSLEGDTGAKIIIRGKGSVKEGKLSRRDGPLPGENEQLHAFVTGSDSEVIKKAVNKIRQIIDEALLMPDGNNELRKTQLKELALLNGTLRPEDMVVKQFCGNCGAEGHKTYECMNPINATASIVCTACGGNGHIAKDCKNPLAGGVVIDEEYQALMNQLNEVSSDPAYTTSMYSGSQQYGNAQQQAGVTVDLNQGRYQQPPTSASYYGGAPQANYGYPAQGMGGYDQNAFNGSMFYGVPPPPPMGGDGSSMGYGEQAIDPIEKMRADALAYASRQAGNNQETTEVAQSSSDDALNQFYAMSNQN
uniref:Branchpoint-bridging protein n=1 Tax=Rhabditophanes sp. KR3021 TaxID=114890 RepID=A0AC35TV11_9BILA